MSNKKTKPRTRKNEIERLRTFNVVLLATVVVLSALVVGMYLKSIASYGVSGQNSANNANLTSSSGTLTPSVNFTAVASEVLPAQGVILPAKWGDAAKQLVDSGALNETALEAAVKQSGQAITPEELRILNGTSTANIILNATDSAFELYVLWGIGINNNNTIINKGPLAKYGGNPDQFASTGGYAPLGTLHLGGMDLVNLTASEQEIANYTAENTYRPCCNNPTMFPDCNHGAAALGLIEIMASQGNNVTATFDAVKAFNSFQYPRQYVEIGVYLKSKNVDFNAVPSAAILSYNASSAGGISSIENYLKTNNLAQSSSGSSSSCGA